MLYYLFRLLRDLFNIPGARLFQYISFRATMAALLSLVISMLVGKYMIKYLQRKQIGETVRNLGLKGENLKAGTPTMGGLLIIAAVLVPTVLFAKLENIYIIMLLISTVWLGLIGFADDYIKVFRKNKEGLKGRFKIVGQVGLGIFIATVMFFHQDIVVREFTSDPNYVAPRNEPYVKYNDVHSLKTTIPFLKNNELDYEKFLPEGNSVVRWLIYAVLITFIITAVSNGANMTDGLDGLAGGTSAIIVATLALFAYVSGNFIFANYLNIMYLPNSGEVVIFCMALVGACIGFLWYNSFPAQVFMGDTGSLMLGGVIAVLSIVLRKELLIPVLCGIFFVENLSVMLQVGYFKYTKKKYGEGRRIFKMAPLHHHFQKEGLHEVKIVNRFWIVGILLAIITVATLKLR